MNLYIAALYHNRYEKDGLIYKQLNEFEASITNAIPHILESYHYIKKQVRVDSIRNNKHKVFLDSGAFSAYTLGVKITVEEYCNYIQQNRDLIRVEDGVLIASVLDGIGDANETWRNQQEIEQRGIKVLPCFHAGEDERYLEHYVRNYEYITLGGMVGSSTKQLSVWLDRVWGNYLVDGSGRPRVKVHGFGITSVPLMERYPWHSCDSSSWIQSASFGTIVNPTFGPISVSEKSPSRHTAGQHAATLTPIEQDYLFQQLEAQGFTYERLSKSYASRAAYNIWAYGVIAATITAAHSDRFKSRVQELF